VLHTIKRYSGKEVVRAGEKLTSDSALSNKEEFSQAMNVLSYWRFTHEQPLEKAYELVEKIASQKDKNSICAKRLKRHVSIVNKLRRFEKMKLRNMQDIGGCRAIFKGIKKLRQVERELKKRPEFKIKNNQPKIKDYVNYPKEDGYRSVHLIGKFKDENGVDKYIEVQLRTMVQHYWATALEIVDLFTNQSLKTNQGEDVWKSFFRDASELFELIDQIHLFDSLSEQAQFDRLYEQTIGQKDEEKREKILECCKRVVKACKHLRIIEKLEAYTGSLKVIDERLKDESIKGYVLLQMNLHEKTVATEVIDEAEAEKASLLYVEAEKKAAIENHTVVALVFSNAVGGIKSAYPNYFADSSQFIKYLAYIRRIFDLYGDNKSFSTSLFKSIFGIKRKS
jgi:ppGpp synthetase/RelA/SpoT-type nucleotidyltranferase